MDISILSKIFLVSLLIMPIFVLFTERYFPNFIIAISFPAFIFSIIVFIMIYKYINKNIIRLSIFILIFFVNITNNVIMCFTGGILISILGMAHYTLPNPTYLIHLSFSAWFLGLMTIVFFILFYVIIKPFINYLVKSILE